MAANAYSSSKHDIGIDYSGTTYGFMLAQEEWETSYYDAKGNRKYVKHRRPIWEELDDEYIAEQMSMGVVGYSDLPPEREIADVHSNWQAGFGEDVFNPSDPYRYFSSTGCDLRFKDRAILSWGETGIAVPSTTAPTAWCEYNAELYIAFGIYLKKLNGNGNGWTAVKTFTSPITDMKVFGDGFMYIAVESTQLIEDCEDDWVDDQGTSDLDTGDYKVGSGSVKLSRGGAGAGETIAYEDISSLDLSDHTGIKLWMKVSSSVAASDLEFLLSNQSALGAKTDVIPLPALIAGRWTKVYARMADPSNCGAILSVGLEYNANAKANTIHLDDIRAESSYWYMDTGENFTQSTLDVTTYDSFAKYFQPVGTTMWKHLPPHRVYSATDPSNLGAANWSTATTVGLADTDITAMVEQKGSLFIMKEGRSYYVDIGGTLEPLTDETDTIASSTGGKNSISWKGALYMPYGESSLIEYDQSAMFNWIDPSLYCTNLSAFDGQVFAIAGDDQWLFAIVDNGLSVEVLAGRNEIVGGMAQWVWHPYQTFTLTGCEMAFVSSVYEKRLWIGSTSGSDSMYYIPLPTSYGDITNDTNADFETGGFFETPWYHFNFKGDNKAFIKLTLVMEDTTDAVYWAAAYEKRGDAGYTVIGDFKTEPSTSLFIPVDSSSNKPTSTDIRFKFTATGTTSSTPILLSYDVRAILYPSRRKIYVATVRCADNIKDKEGTTMTTTAANIITYIDAAKDTTWPVTINDPWGTEKTVRFLPAKPAARLIRQEKGRNPEKHYFLVMQSVTLS